MRLFFIFFFFGSRRVNEVVHNYIDYVDYFRKMFKNKIIIIKIETYEKREKGRLYKDRLWEVNVHERMLHF